MLYFINKGGKEMDNKKIDFVVHEADMNRMERVNKRQFILNIILIIIIFLIIGGLLAYSMLPSEVIEGTQTASGDNIQQSVGK